MATESRETPPGPAEEYRSSDDLLNWIGHHFNTFGDIYKASVYGTTVYIVRDLEFARHVLVENWQNYVKGQFIKRVAFLLGNGLMVSEGELWKRQRRMIQPAFHPKSIGALTELLIAVNLSVLEKWQLAAEQDATLNVTHDVSAMALEVMLRAVFGQDYASIAAHFNLLTDEPARDWAFAQAFRALRKIILQVAERRRSASTSAADFLGILMQTRDPRNNQSMPDAQMINEIITLIVAGHETTASTLNWTWYLLSQHPHIEQKLSDEAAGLKHLSELDNLLNFPYSRQIIDESMRLYPAGWLMTRRALHDDRLGSYFVAAGTEIYVSPYFIHRHPGVWEEPDRFDPDRFNPGYSRNRHRLAALPFSAGPRNCIGSLFARIEMQIHLLLIARHLRLGYILAQPPELDAGVNLRSKSDFIMSAELKSAARL